MSHARTFLRQRARPTPVAPFLVLALALSLGGCGAAGAPAISDPAPSTGALPFASLGEVEDSILEVLASAVPADLADSDGDRIPDLIEERLGTDPNLADTDRDGLVDGIELFGEGWQRSDPLPDRDGDLLIAPADGDDDGDRANDGMTVDTDGDGVPNYHELYGYTFDVLTGRFLPWDGDPAVEPFFTDPLQPSTDQDAYPDGAEASRALTDPTVRSPGDDPLVPAYPNLVCELVSYSVTLDEEIQVSETESYSKGQSWTRQTDRTHSFGVQNTWEVSGQASWGTQAGYTVSAKYGQTYDNTNSTTTSLALGGSITSDEGWSAARSMNPTHAARIKLLLRVHNRGTAPVSNLVPTLSLKIGGLNVATFEPAGAPVNLLIPGATYPAEPGWLWVVDAVSGGAPLYLTMTELRALERGAPISLSVAQIQGDAMRLAPGGAWQSVGDTNEFTARCDAVCANLRIELEDGTLVHHLVYAGDGPGEPVMTLGRALRKLGLDDGGVLRYTDEDGVPRVRSLDGYHMTLDAATLRANGWTLSGDDLTGSTETAAPPGFSLPDTRLLPASVVYVRAPRPPAGPPGPTVHFASFDPDTGEILVSAADYEGIARVVVHNQLDPSDEGYREQTLAESVPGAGFFAGNARGPDGFDDADVLSARIENLAGHVETRLLGSLFVVPGPQKPVIHEASLDLDAHRVYARVESGNPDNPNSNIQWVRAYHPDFPGGFTEMEPVYDYYRDPLGYDADLPAGFGEDHKEDVEVVAYVTHGVHQVASISFEEATPVQIRHQATWTLHPVADAEYNLVGALKTILWDMPRLKFGAAKGSTVVSTPRVSSLSRPTIPGAPYDIVLQMDQPSATAWARMHFNAEYRKLPVGGLDAYRGLSRDEIVAMDAEISSRDGGRVGAAGSKAELRAGDVLALRTIDGLPAKLYIESVTYDHNVLRDQWWADVKVRYVVFEKP